MNMHQLITVIENKKVLEVGGPSELLHSLYAKMESISLLNHSESKEAHSYYMNPINTIDVYDGDAAENGIFEKYNLFEKFEVIITSHTLEHIANPIKALEIWKKCLVPEGKIITIVPNKEECWDRVREDTSNEHLLQDYLNDTLEDDMTHVHESSCMPRPNYYEEVGESNSKRIIHHHIFSIENLKFVHEHLDFITEECYVDDNDKLQMIYIGKK